MIAGLTILWVRVASFNDPFIGIILTEGPLWRDTRRFALRHLRDFGFGKACMETSIMEEVINMINFVQVKAAKENGRIQFDEIFGPMVLSTLWKMIAGVYCDLNDKRILELQRIVRDTLRRRAIGITKHQRLTISSIDCIIFY